MAPYLPQGGTGGGGSPYSEGGALYALGLIHANHGEGIKQFLRDSLRSTTVEVLINIDRSLLKKDYCYLLYLICCLWPGHSTWCMSGSWIGVSRNC